jgi:hypothetical protein
MQDLVDHHPKLAFRGIHFVEPPESYSKRRKPAIQIIWQSG